MRQTVKWKHPELPFTFRLRLWECCGMKWELLLSNKFPEREKWNPTCTKCGKEINE